MAAPTCLCCGESLDMKATKTKKPYLSCTPCGVQVLVRGPAGVQKFEKKYGAAWRGEAGEAAAPAAAPKKKPGGDDIMEFDDDGDEDADQD